MQIYELRKWTQCWRFTVKGREAPLHYRGAQCLAAAAEASLASTKVQLDDPFVAVQQSKSISHASLSSGKKVTLAVICLTMA